MIHSQPDASSLALRIGQRRTGFTLPGSVRRVLPGGPLASPEAEALVAKLKAAQTRRVTP